MRKLRLGILLLFAAALIAGCVAHHQMTRKMYAGAPKPAGEVALLRTGYHFGEPTGLVRIKLMTTDAVTVDRVDGERVWRVFKLRLWGPPLQDPPEWVEILPGLREIEVKYYVAGIPDTPRGQYGVRRSKKSIVLRFHAEAGHEYLVSYAASWSHWTAWVDDSTTGKRHIEVERSSSEP